MGIKSERLLIRTNVGTHIGLGHVMRCLALAQAWQDSNGVVGFALVNDTASIEARLLEEGMQIYPVTAVPGSDDDAGQTIALAKSINSNWVVVDGYQFADSYQQTIKEAGLNLLFLDDYKHANRYFADLILNQNIKTEENLYNNRETFTDLLLGAKYILLRREFLHWRGEKREIPDVANKLLITLGGGDPDNQTSKVLHALMKIKADKVNIKVVVGANNSHFNELQNEINNSGLNIQLVQNFWDMAGLMAWADIAISGGGSTCYELAFMGLPSLVIVLADNQYMVASGLESAGISINLGWYASVSAQDIAVRFTELANSANARAEMSNRGRTLVDGYGAARVVHWMHGRALTLREAQESDSRLIYEWANDPTTRSVSFSTDAIPWETHQAWYTAKLSDPHSIILIGLDSSLTPVGMVRYQLDGLDSVISINLDPHQRGKGYGVQILQLSSKRLFQTGKTDLIHAYIKPDNKFSIHAFIKAGFVEKDKVDFQGNPASHFILSEEML